MLATFETIQKNFKIKPQIFHIDNFTFKLHYRVTTLIFLIATLLVTSRQYIGEHIKCISDAGVPEHVMNTFCFFTTTFTVIKHYDVEMVKSGNVAHPGVGAYGGNSTEPIQHHAYYQWVPFMLFGQAIMFHLTHLLWKKIEGGRLRLLVEGLQMGAFSFLDKGLSGNTKNIPSKTQKEEYMQMVKTAFMDRMVFNRSWSLGLALCEVLNLLNVILQIFITNEFLSGQFLNLGVQVMNEGIEEYVSVLDEIFPKVTKCTFHKYGPSGSLQLHDAMCVMALNIINEKIYIFLWFWLLIMFIISCLTLVWRVLTVVLHAKSTRFNRAVFASSCPGKINPWNVLTVTRYCSFTDWLFLRYLAKNLDGLVFRELFIGLAEEIHDRKPQIDFDNEEDTSTLEKKPQKFE